MLRRRFRGAAAALVLPCVLALTQGCTTDPTEELCCAEFKVGATVDANISGNVQSQVAAQAVADFAGIASAAVDDVTAACRSIAQDLDAPKADQDAAEATTDKRARLDAWCGLAVKAIGSFKAQAGGTLTVTATPPKCEASVSAKASCQAKCSVDGKCDLKANPPKCTGGSLQVACKGECKAKAGATLTCEGKCTGECQGSCTAQGGVACKGKCEGTCKGAAQGGTGAGIQADGTCDGTCEGTCEVTAPGAECSGSCSGECGVSCTGSAEASVKCDGECSADFEPLKCEGGKLEGGCQVDAKCDSSCDASVSAKAECTPPAVSVAFTGAANADAALKLKAALEANLGAIFAFQARLEGMVNVAATFGANLDAVTDLKVACIPPMLAAANNSFDDVKASFKATGDIVATTK